MISRDNAQPTYNGSTGNGYTGRYPSGAVSVGAPGTLSSLPPAEQAAQVEAGSGAGKQLVADQNYLNGSAQRKYQLTQALASLENATTGKGSEALNNIKSYLQTVGVPGIDANKIASYDKANKYLTQYALSQASGMGAGTNEKLAATLSGNASTNISKLAAQDVVRANLGMEDMKRAQILAFNASGEPKSNAQSFATEWNSKVDPNVFIWNYLPQDKKQKAYDSMSAAQRKKFSQQYNSALGNGWISAPGK